MLKNEQTKPPHFTVFHILEYFLFRWIKIPFHSPNNSPNLGLNKPVQYL